MAFHSREGTNMGAKSPGNKGGGKGGKTGGGSVPNTARINVSLKVADAKTLLGSLTTGTATPPGVAKTVALAVVRSLSGGGSGKGKGKGKGKPKGTPKGKGTKLSAAGKVSPAVSRGAGPKPAATTG